MYIKGLFQKLTYRTYSPMVGLLGAQRLFKLLATVWLCPSCLQADSHSGPVRARSQRAPLYSPLLSLTGKTRAYHRGLAVPGPWRTSLTAHTALSRLLGGPDKETEKEQNRSFRRHLPNIYALVSIITKSRRSFWVTIQASRQSHTLAMAK